MFTDRIVKFGNNFRDRLDPCLLQGALDYTAYNEESLAFEVLCDHICEYDIPLTDEEYKEAVKLIQDMELDLGEGPFKHLLSLKR
ncbi:MafI family immunity protein [Pseudomonas sp.]|uniref:MafI family immunity protein n=1 Tax=Pseudomonas sp. TaxID=306 RepID=UPI0028A7A648|nr:MafI family immunity protein [Pseudomonas sp.]